MRSKAFTLIEVLIASAIGLIVVGAVIALFTITTTDVDDAQASYALEESLATSVKYLQTDLRYTTLGSVAVWPRENSTKDQIGISFLSAEPIGSFGKVEISRFGAPKWQKHVFYTTQNVEKEDGISRLVRYEIPTDPKDFQVVSSHLPYDYSSDKGQIVVAKRILKSGWKVRPGQKGEVLTEEESSPGGFIVKFLQQDGTTTTVNPSLNDPSKSSGVLEVELTLLDNSELGSLSAIPIRFRAAPRN